VGRVNRYSLFETLIILIFAEEKENEIESLSNGCR
jgi:hypothetical protein